MKFYELMDKFNQSKNTKDTFEIYNNNFQSCSEHKLEIISSDKNMAINLPILKEIMDLPNIMTIFEYPNLAFYNSEIVLGMVDGRRAPFSLDYSISFESNSARYLHDYLTTGTCNGKNFETTLHTLLERNYNLDPMFYMIENSAKDNKSNKFYENLYSIKKLMTCDMNYYYKTKKIKSVFTDIEVQNIVKEDLYHLENKFKPIIDKAKEQQLTMKIILLAMTFARYKYTNEKEQVSYLVKFMSEKLKTIFLRELFIAINYFYFEKINKEKPDFFNPLNGQVESNFFKKLDGMAWDFTLVRQLEMYFTSKPNPKADFFIPFLFTYDEGLIEVMKMFYCKDFLIFHKDRRTIPIPSINKFNMEKIEEYGLSHYFTEEAMNNRLQNNIVDFEKVFNELKNEFIELRMKTN
ncbi:MAG: hypothetical protein RBR07_06060 [Arcobacteraceae bacterium]|nr:hypothetical protein [Arcobacteraceae bacterium]